MRRIESAICVWDRLTSRERTGGRARTSLLRRRQLTLFRVRAVMVDLDCRAVALLQGAPHMIDASLDLVMRSRVSPPPSILLRSDVSAWVLSDCGLVIPRLHALEAVWLDGMLDAEVLDTRAIIACLAWVANRAVTDSILGIGTATIEAHEVFPPGVSNSPH